MKRYFPKLISVILLFSLIICSFTAFATNADSPKNILFSGKATSTFTDWSNWQSALSLGTNDFDKSKLNKPFTVSVTFESKDVPILIFQSWSGGTSWAHMIPSYTSKGTSYFMFDTISEYYGTDFSKLDSIKIMPNGSDLTVTEVAFTYESDSINVPYKGLAGEIANSINAGWNLGNTLDAHADWIVEMTEGKPTDFETAWCNPITTKAMIEDIKSAGFNAVRVPVTWKQHIDTSGNVDKAWMDRVQEVVDYVIESDMYCILNVHHDTGEGGWLKATESCVKEQGDKFAYLWTQIAERFKNYESKLLFEGFNEILDNTNNWDYAGKEATKAVNDLNQIFVDAVRSTGAENLARCLVVNTYAANTIAGNLDEFELPIDSAKNSLIVEVHYYHPYKYCTASYPNNRTWLEENGKCGINGMLYNLYEHFTSKGIPVIIGEYGVSNKENTADRCEYANYLITKAKEYGIKCFWWDPSGYTTPDADYGYLSTMILYDRFNMNWVFPELTKSITGVDPNAPITTATATRTTEADQTASTAQSTDATEPQTTQKATDPTETETATTNIPQTLPTEAISTPSSTATIEITATPTETTSEVIIIVPPTSTATVQSSNIALPSATATAPDKTLIVGDADLNEKINIKDATLIQKHLAQLLELDEAQLKVSDTDKNATVNIKDATAIQCYIANIPRQNSHCGKYL